MTEVTRLIEYMEVICDRPYTRDEHHIISQNELVAVYDEFESLLSMVEDAKVKASQRRLKNDKLSAFIEQYAIQLYDYAYRIKVFKIVEIQMQMSKRFFTVELITRAI